MVDSRLGRTDRSELWKLGLQAGRRAKAKDGDVRKPGTALAFVGADLLEPTLNRFGHPHCLSGRVLEDEHADASSLAVAEQLERHRPGTGCGAAKDFFDWLDLFARPGAEKGDRGMEVLRRDEARPAFGELRPLPRGEPLTVVGRKCVSDEEAYPFIAAHASGRAHTSMCPICVRRRLRRWSAATAAKRRTWFRSPLKRSSCSICPSGPAAQKKTRPTGFSAVPPPGPAMPVIPTATSTPSTLLAPSASSSAHSAETAPRSARVFSGTTSTFLLISSA